MEENCEIVATGTQLPRPVNHWAALRFQWRCPVLWDCIYWVTWNPVWKQTCQRQIRRRATHNSSAFIHRCWFRRLILDITSGLREFGVWAKRMPWNFELTRRPTNALLVLTFRMFVQWSWRDSGNARSSRSRTDRSECGRLSATEDSIESELVAGYRLDIREVSVVDPTSRVSALCPKSQNTRPARSMPPAPTTPTTITLAIRVALWVPAPASRPSTE